MARPFGFAHRSEASGSKTQGLRGGQQAQERKLPHSISNFIVSGASRNRRAQGDEETKSRRVEESKSRGAKASGGPLRLRSGRAGDGSRVQGVLRLTLRAVSESRTAECRVSSDSRCLRSAAADQRLTGHDPRLFPWPLFSRIVSSLATGLP